MSVLIKSTDTRTHKKMCLIWWRIFTKQKVSALVGVRGKSVEMKILAEKVDSFYIRGHLEATVVVVDQLD